MTPHEHDAPPPFAGGQGRSPEDVAADGRAALVWAGIAAAVAALAAAVLLLLGAWRP